MVRTLSCLAALVLAALPASAETSQLLKQIDLGLRSHGIHTDVSALTGRQAAALHLELGATEDEMDIRTRDTLLWILSWTPETEPYRK